MVNTNPTSLRRLMNSLVRSGLKYRMKINTVESFLGISNAKHKKDNTKNDNSQEMLQASLADKTRYQSAHDCGQQQTCAGKAFM